MLNNGLYAPKYQQYSPYSLARRGRCMGLIAQIAPLSFQGSHRTQTQTSEVRWACTLQWSLSGHQHVCISNSWETFTEATKKTSNGRLSQLNQYWSYKPYSNFKPAWNFLKILCNLNDTFDKNKKYWSRYWGSTAKTGSLLGIKQT